MIDKCGTVHYVKLPSKLTIWDSGKRCAHEYQFKLLSYTINSKNGLADKGKE